MKKLFAVGSMILIVSHVFALDPGNGYTTSKNSPATTLVTFDLSSTGEDANTYFELYFTTSENEALGTETPKTITNEVSLTFSDPTSPVATNSNPLYVWWKIVSPKGINVKLGIKSPLTATQSTTAEAGATDNTIGWTASWADITANENSVQGSISSPEEATDQGIVLYSEKPMGTHTGSPLGSYGRKEVTIRTTEPDFTDNVSGTYQAYLYLNCFTE